MQLIDATGERFWSQMRKSLGQKRREISDVQIDDIVSLYESFDEADDDVSKIFDTIDFGYRKVTIEQPLRLNFQATPERIERVKEENNLPEPCQEQEAQPRSEGGRGSGGTRRTGGDFGDAGGYAAGLVQEP